MNEDPSEISMSGEIRNSNNEDREFGLPSTN